MRICNRFYSVKSNHLHWRKKLRIYRSIYTLCPGPEMTPTWPFLTSSKLKLAASDVLFIRQSFSLQCMADGIVKDHKHQANWPAMKKILPSWFDQKKEFFRYREVQFKTFCPPVKRQTLIKLLGCFIMTNVYFIQVNTMMISMIENA